MLVNGKPLFQNGSTTFAPLFLVVGWGAMALRLVNIFSLKCKKNHYFRIIEIFLNGKAHFNNARTAFFLVVFRGVRKRQTRQYPLVKLKKNHFFVFEEYLEMKKLISKTQEN